MNLQKLNQLSVEEAQERIGFLVDKFKEDKDSLKKIGFCLAAAIVLTFGSKGINNYFKTSLAATIEKRDEYKNIQDFLDVYQNDAQEYKKEISKVSGKILEESSIDKSITFVQKLAESHGVKVTNSQRAEKAKSIGKEIHTQTVNLSLIGPYTGIIQMLNELENAGFFVSIDTITLKQVAQTNGSQAQGKPTDSDEKSVEARLSYTLFYQTDKKAK